MMPNCTAGSARILRQLMFRARLDAHSAARELAIDARTMEGYVSGKPVPMPVVFRLMMLADMGPPPLAGEGVSRPSGVRPATHDRRASHSAAKPAKMRA